MALSCGMHNAGPHWAAPDGTLASCRCERRLRMICLRCARPGKPTSACWPTHLWRGAPSRASTRRARLISSHASTSSQACPLPPCQGAWQLGTSALALLPYLFKHFARFVPQLGHEHGLSVSCEQGRGAVRRTAGKAFHTNFACSPGQLTCSCYSLAIL